MVQESFSFGVVADIQYADKDANGSRAYRDALTRLEKCIAEWNELPLSFCVELGDACDDRKSREDCDNDLKTVLKTFTKLRHPLHHILGNHGLASLGWKHKCKLLGLPVENSWNSFSFRGWRFIILNSLAMNAIAPDSPGFSESSAFFEANRGEARPELQDFNGGLGKTQRAWLSDSLREAKKLGEKALIFCHLPFCEEAIKTKHLLWDYREVIEIIDASPALEACFSGHDHWGGYALRKGVHHLTFPGLIELEKAFFTVEVFSGKIIVRSSDTERILDLSQ